MTLISGVLVYLESI